MSRDRNSPPTEWLADVAVIDEPTGIYLGPTFRADTDNPTFWHWCPGAPSGPRWYAMGTGLHTVYSRDPWHLEASLLCTDCGLHGWIRDGRWTSA